MDYKDFYHNLTSLSWQRRLLYYASFKMSTPFLRFFQKNYFCQKSAWICHLFESHTSFDTFFDVSLSFFSILIRKRKECFHAEKTFSSFRHRTRKQKKTPHTAAAVFCHRLSKGRAAQRPAPDVFRKTFLPHPRRLPADSTVWTAARPAGPSFHPAVTF